MAREDLVKVKGKRAGGLHGRWPVGLLHRHLDRPQHGPGLGLGLRELVVGPRVGDRAAAGLHVGHAVLEHHGADVDAGVEVAAVSEVADRAAVDAALDRLELVDDLHRADLRARR